MLIMNCTNEEQSVKALGNWFTFKPGQIKSMNEDIAKFIGEMRKENGLMILPESCEDVEYRNSEEGKAELEKIKEEGVNHYVRALRALIYNNQVSLRQDLERADIKVDPAVFASEGELKAMELVAKYQKHKDDADQKKIDRVKELVKQVGPISRS